MDFPGNIGESLIRITGLLAETGNMGVDLLQQAFCVLNCSALHLFAN
jgi:hypothetical protein